MFYLRSWLRQFAQRLSLPTGLRSRKKVIRLIRKRAGARLNLEELESRITPGGLADTWTGVGNWDTTTPGFWSTGSAPTLGQNVVIQSGAVTLSDSQTVGTVTIGSNAALTLANGSLTSSGVALQNLSTLSGPGTIVGNVTSSGTVDPTGVGGSTGTLSIAGTYTQSPGGTLALDVGGTSAGQYDVLAVSSTAALGGTLDVNLVNGFTLSQSTALTQVVTGVHTGKFAALTSQASNGLTLTPNLGSSASSVSLQAVPTGTTVYWVGPTTGGNWNTAADWSTDVAPVSTDTAYIGAGNTVTFSSGSPTVANLDVDGTLNVTGGNLSIGSGGMANDNFNFFSGILSGSGTLSDSGTAEWTGGTMQGAGTTDFNGATSISGGTLQGGRTVGGTGATTFSSGTITVGPGGGTFDFTTGGFTWSGGTINGTGTLTNAPTGTMTISSNNGPTLSGATLTNQGTITETGSNSSLNLTSGAVLNNSGTFDIAQTFSGFANPISVSGGVFNNENTGVLELANSVTDTFSSSFSNTGTVEVTAGTLRIAGPIAGYSSGTLTGGTWEVFGGSSLDLTTAAAVATDAANLILDGAGSSILTGSSGNTDLQSSLTSIDAAGNLYVQNGATFTTSSAFNDAGSIDLRNGTLVVTSDLILNGSIQVGDRTDANKPGHIIFAGGAPETVSGPAASLGYIFLVASPNNSLFTNSGTPVEIGRDVEVIGQSGDIGGNAPIVFDDGSTLEANTAGGTITINTPSLTFGDVPVVAINGGTLNIDPTTLTNFSAGTLTNGFWQVFANSTLRVFLLSGITTNDATVYLDGANSNFYNGPDGVDAFAGLTTNEDGFFIEDGRDFTTAGDFTNNGFNRVEIGSGSTFTVGGDGVYTQGASETSVFGTLIAAGGVNLQAGTLNGFGTVQGDVTNAGAFVQPSLFGSAGTLTIDGNYTQTDGALILNVGNPTSPFNDELNVTGEATLSGQLRVTTASDYTPIPGDEFQIFTFGSLSGNFTDEIGVFPNFTLGQTSAALTLTENIVVSNTADSGPGSLRQAITDADAVSSNVNIFFDIPAADADSNGVYLIQPLSELPQITNTVNLDGTSEPGYTNQPIIQIDGTNLVGPGDGLELGSGASTIKGLMVTNFTGAGIHVEGASETTITQNWIGLDLDATTDTPVAAGNVGDDVLIDNTGFVTVEDNVIDGSSAAGVDVSGPNATDNIVQGNLIGTDPTGLSPIGNTTGVILQQGASNNTIGGLTVGAGNVISGNSGDGVDLSGTSSFSTTGNVVEGNFIGTDVTGAVTLANLGDGVRLAPSASGNTIGGRGRNCAPALSRRGSAAF